jgi:hypothetical protein
MITVRNFTGDQARRGARLLARAFATDPIITHFLDGFVRRQFAFPAFFRAIIREHLEGGHVYSAWEEDRLIGVAVWSPFTTSFAGITSHNKHDGTVVRFDLILPFLRMEVETFYWIERGACLCPNGIGDLLPT